MEQVSTSVELEQKQSDAMKPITFKQTIIISLSLSLFISLIEIVVFHVTGTDIMPASVILSSVGSSDVALRFVISVVIWSIANAVVLLLLRRY